MTTIACDGLTIASDSRISGDGIDPFFEKPKFGRLAGRRPIIVAAAGALWWSGAFRVWAGKQRSKYPETDADEGTAVTFDGARWRTYLSQVPHPELGPDVWALGSGRHYALTALTLGHCPVAAVWAAMQLDPNSGGSVFVADVKELLKVGDGAIKKIRAEEARPRPSKLIQARVY